MDLRTQLAAQLVEWSRAASEVRPLLESNSLLAEDAPVADAAVIMCKAGTEALGYVDSPAPEGWRKSTLDAVKNASSHAAGLLLPFAPAVQKLVENTR